MNIQEAEARVRRCEQNLTENYADFYKQAQQLGGETAQRASRTTLKRGGILLGGLILLCLVIRLLLPSFVSILLFLGGLYCVYKNIQADGDIEREIVAAQKNLTNALNGKDTI